MGACLPFGYRAPHRHFMREYRYYRVVALERPIRLFNGVGLETLISPSVTRGAMVTQYWIGMVANIHLLGDRNERRLTCTAGRAFR